MDVHRLVLEAAKRLAGRVVRTPLVHSAALSERSGAEVFLKLETLQHTGSFKIRGALNRLLALEEDERLRGVIAASTGNHGLAILRAAAETGTEAEIWVPESAEPGKVSSLRELGASLVVAGAECAETEILARAEAESSGRVYVSAYNDLLVVAGQGTIGPEILDELPSVTAVVASVGGGGLISGVAGYLTGERPGTRVYGALPERSPAMAESVRAGRIVDAPVGPTLSDATAGGVEPGAVTFDLCRRLVSGWTIRSEDEIADWIRILSGEGHTVEGSAALAAAGTVALALDRVIGSGDVVCAVLCGRNIDSETHRRILNEEAPR